MAVYFSKESLQTDPELMQRKAIAVQTKINQMKTAFGNLEYAVERTGTYWLGEAGDAYRAAFDGEKENIDTIILRLFEHVRDLQNMAAVYAGIEKEIEDIANDLPSDVIC